MKRSNRNLSRIVTLARKVAPLPAEPLSSDDVRFFSHRTAAEWSRQRRKAAPPDALRLWERVGAWSLATSVAVVLLVTAFSPDAPKPDPFGPWVQDEVEETLYF